jgi:class 3 adenylate cyclase
MAITSRQTMCWSDTGELRQATERPSLMESVSVICAPLWRQNRVRGALYLDTHRVMSFGPPQTEMASAIALFTAVALDLFEQREQNRQQQELRKKLEQYMQAEVVEELINQGLGGDLMLATQAEVTVLFGDLRGFTSLSEKTGPAEVVQLLNEVFGRMIEVIFRHGGTLDKFMGDGIMVYFGHPRAYPDHPIRAVRAGLEMQAALAEFNRQQPPDQQIQIRIGINTGPVIAGDIGGAGRKDYTVIGNTVNVASRFESQIAAPKPGGQSARCSNARRSPEHSSRGSRNRSLRTACWAPPRATDLIPAGGQVCSQQPPAWVSPPGSPHLPDKKAA